jgi:Flp pilus assembly protein TadD
MGQLLQKQGRTEEAIRHYYDALAFQPAYLRAHCALGVALLGKRDWSGAVEHLERVVRDRPDDAPSHNDLGVALMLQGNVSKAVCHLHEAVRLKPETPGAHYTLGQVFLRLGRWGEAAAAFSQAVALRPQDSLYHRSWAFALHKQGQIGQAQVEYQESMRLEPNWPQDALQVAWALATDPDSGRRNGPWAILVAEQASQATGEQDPKALDALAAAYAECGRFSDAVAVAHKAQAQASARGQMALASEIEDRLRLYQRRQPFRADRTGE